MNIKPGEMWEIGPGGARCVERAYPTPSEPHSCADLLRPLAADNARLRAERDALVEQCVEYAARVLVLEARIAALGRVPR